MECADVMAIASKGRFWSNLINLLFGKAFANKVLFKLKLFRNQ